ncbi:alpha/beta fold hydrolase [Actinoallomurus sp. CA-150999]|uniref:alpha/beta fold hydrolase n=1 Tax=Actinoallomurus sp. CA-150999 TaxID=3239887 RepID=UPI003D8A9F23
MPYVQVDGGRRIFYAEEGSGPDAVLMIHGWGCDGSDWAWLMADLSRDHRCVAIDNRGHGRSAGVPGAYAPRAFAADALEVIDRLGLVRPVIIGHSLGTLIGSVLAVEHPEVMRALVLVDPVYHGEDARLAAVVDALRRAPHEVAAELYGDFFYSERTPSWIPIWHRRRLLGTDEGAVLGTIVGLQDGTDGLGRRVVAERYLPRRGVPTLAFYGGDKPAEVALERRLQRGPLDAIEFWPEHGHFLHQEAPERFATAVRRWLETLPDSGRPT